MIEATYTVSEKDFLEAQKVWCSKEVKKLPGKVLAQVAGLIFGGFVGATFHYLPIWFEVALALSLLTSFGITQWRKKALGRYQYLLRQHCLQSITVCIDEEGYRDEKAGECSVWMSWKHFSGWLETAHIFVIGLNLSYITVPKEALSVNQQTELRTLLTAKLPPAKR